jgi:hypothetical protein
VCFTAAFTDGDSDLSPAREMKRFARRRFGRHDCQPVPNQVSILARNDPVLISTIPLTAYPLAYCSDNRKAVEKCRCCWIEIPKDVAIVRHCEMSCCCWLIISLASLVDNRK